MAVIFFDTDCELWYEQIKQFDVQVIKMPYTVEDTEYFYDLGESTDFDGFYKSVRAGNMPTTSALNEYQYIEYFEPYFAKNEEILYISFGTNFSGTFEQMKKAVNTLSQKYPDARFTRFDTNSISFAAGMQVYYALKYYSEGHTITETVEYLEQNVNNYSVVFMVDDLMHLKRGGRLSGVAALVGTIIGIKPMLKVSDEGRLTVYNKQKGTKKAISFMLSELQNNGVDLDKYAICVLDADNKELGDLLEQKVRELYPNSEIWHYPVGPVIGTHCGPGTVALFFRSKQR